MKLESNHDQANSQTPLTWYQEVRCLLMIEKKEEFPDLVGIKEAGVAHGLSGEASLIGSSGLESQIGAGLGCRIRLTLTLRRLS